MYQGKFDKKKKSSTVSVEEIVASRNSTAPAKKEAPVKKEFPIPEAAPEAPAKKRSVPFDQDAQIPKKQPVKEQPVKEAPAKKPAKEVSSQAAPKRRGPRLGGVIFYTLYFLFIFLFFVAVFFGLQWIQNWLIDYEAAQPTTKSQEVFQQLFDDPDWGALYDAAEIQDTAYEGRDAFVSYMESEVGDSGLTYQETSAGTSKDKKYFVKLGDQRIAYFTLTDLKQTSGGLVPTDIPEWTLGEVGLYFDRENGYRIQTADGHVPHVNGIALTDDHVIQISTVKRDENFLPSDVESPKTSIYEISGLLITPTITITDKSGAQMEVVYDEASGMFVEQTKEVSISEEEKNVALNALKTYAKYGVREAFANDLGVYFDPTGTAYKSIIQTELGWTKGNRGISFDKDTVTDYCRYSDTMFSVYATTEMTINLTDGGTQEKTINSTLLFSKTSGSWKVIKMTNANIAEPVGKVRLTFMHDDRVLHNDFYDIESETLETPMISVPDGKVFSGWMKETIGANGSKTMTLVFQPDENGDVSLPKGTTLQPMVLYPLFEDAATVQAAAEATEGA